MGATTLLLSSGLNTGCTTWSRAVVPPAPSHRGEVMQVWQGDTSFVVDDARLSGDTVAGQVSTKRGRSGSHILVPQSATDSVRTRQFDLGKTFLTVMGTGIAGFLLLGLIVYSGGREDT